MNHRKNFGRQERKETIHRGVVAACLFTGLAVFIEIGNSGETALE